MKNFFKSKKLDSLNVLKNNKKILPLLLVIVITFIGGFCVNLMLGDKFNSSIEGAENMNKASLVYYYMESCGHCKKFTPEWEKFTKKYKSNSKLNMKKIENKEDKPKNHEDLVEGYPTIILDLNNDKEPIVFPSNKERSVEGLEEFLKENNITL